jgi:hypothetical protein
MNNGGFTKVFFFSLTLAIPCRSGAARQRNLDAQVVG